MTKIRDLHAAWMKDSDYRKEYDALEAEFALVETSIKASFPPIDERAEPMQTDDNPGEAGNPARSAAQP